jgi:Methylase involved in ubiquinone/menaquinone biosynthesis
MEDHIIDAEEADVLESRSRYGIVSRQEIKAEIKRDDIVADIGSGTGFFTDDMAEPARKVYAVDFQDGMHEYYREKGVPENVNLVSADASEFNPGQELDIAFLITSLHEMEIEETIEHLSQVLREGGGLFVVNWSSNTDTGRVPARDKLISAEEASEIVSEFFEVDECQEKRDTYILKAENT